MTPASPSEPSHPAAAPSDFDRPVPLTRPPVMIALVAAVALLAAGIYAAVSATVTTTAEGTGLLLNGGTVIPATATTAGQVTSRLVSPGDSVAAASPLARLTSADGSAVNVAAPAAGTVLQLSVVPGQVVKPGDVVGQLVDTSAPFQVSGVIPESEMSGVAVGVPAKLYPANSSSSVGYLAGTVSFVDGLVATEAQVAAVLGTSTVTQAMTAAGPVRFVQVSLDSPTTDPTSLSWTGSPPASPVGNGTVMRIEVITGEESVAELLGAP